MIGTVAIAEKRAAPGQDPPFRIRAPRNRSSVDSTYGARGGVKAASSAACLDQLGERPAAERQILALACQYGRGMRSFVAAEAVVQHRPRILGDGDRLTLAVCSRVLDARLDHLQRTCFLTPPGCKHE